MLSDVVPYGHRRALRFAERDAAIRMQSAESFAGGVDRSALRKRAAEFYRARGDYTQALRFWLESGDFKGMDTYLLLYLYESSSGSVADCADFMGTLRLDELPDRAYRDCPPLHILALWYDYLTGRRERFEHHLDQMYRALPRIAAFDPRFIESATLSHSIDHRTTIIDKAKRFSKFGRLIKRFTPKGLATTLTSFSQNLVYPHRSNVDYSAIALEPDGMDLLGRTFAPLLGTEWRYIHPLIPACFAYERNRLEEASRGPRGRAGRARAGEQGGRARVHRYHGARDAMADGPSGEGGSCDGRARGLRGARCNAVLAQPEGLSG